jgi:O-antigen/teichoic acid export membrane protein
LQAISFSRKLIRQYWRGEFLRNVTLLASGTAVAQVIMIASMPVLSRLYGPEAFGAVAFFASVTSFFTVLSTFRYELAIPLAREEESAANILVLTSLVAAVISLASIPVVAVGQHYFDLEVSGVSELLVVIAVPLVVLVSGTGRALGFWATRRKNFKLISVSEVFRSSIVTTVQIIGGLAAFGANGLIIGRLAGFFLSTALLAFYLLRRELGWILKVVEAKKIKALAREHSVFPKYNLPRAILNTTSRNLMPLLLVFIFDPVVAGLYWFAFRLLQMPISLIGNAVRRVFYQRAIEIDHAAGDLTGLFTKTTLVLFALAVGPVVVIVLFGPALFGLVFGEDWVRAGEYSQWLVIGWSLTFANVPSVMLIPVLNLQKLALVIDAIKVVLQCVAIPAAAYLGNDMLAIVAFSAVTIVANAFLIGFMYFHIRRHKNASPA